MEAPKVQRLRGRDQALPVGGAGLKGRGASEEPRAPSGRHPGPTPRLQVDMLYEEALYTVLHRAGTMGPDQVDDEEALLSYLQVSPSGPAHSAGLAPAWGWPRHFPPPACVTVASATHRVAPHTYTHRCTGRHTQADRHAQEGGHTNTSKQKNTQRTQLQRTLEKTGRQM